MKNVRDVIILALVGTISDGVGVSIRDTIVSIFKGEINKIYNDIDIANTTGFDASKLITKKEKLNELIDSIKNNKNMNEILDMIVDID